MRVNETSAFLNSILYNLRNDVKMKNNNELDKIVINGIEIHNVTMNETVKYIDKLIQDKSRSHYGVTLNVGGMRLCNEDPTLFKAIKNADIVVNDAKGLEFLSHFIGQPLKQRVAGVDLVWELCLLASKKDYSIYLIGDVLKVQKAFMNRIKSELNISKIGNYVPPFGDWSPIEQELIDNINEFEPDIIFIATYFGKGEKWLFQNKKRVKFGFGVQIGGSFKIQSNLQKRAPPFIQRIGLEGVYLNLRQPHRIKGIQIPMMLHLIYLFRNYNKN
jgi:N-acetylglucosaminyldiphosphoundecaprenol N-acetyl-beta-D-mannosaminyltransferase